MKSSIVYLLPAGETLTRLCKGKLVEWEDDLQELTKVRMKKKGKLIGRSKVRSSKYESMFPDDMKL